jgi:hypothetical protein
VPANFQRYLPFILGAFLLLIVISSLTHKSSSSSPTASAQSTEAIDTLNLVARAEQHLLGLQGRYSGQMADLIVANHALAEDLAEGVTVQLDLSSDGKAYYALVQSPVLSLVRAADDGKVVASTCVVVKSGSGVACPGSSKKTSSSSGTTTSSG